MNGPVERPVNGHNQVPADRPRNQVDPHRQTPRSLQRRDQSTRTMRGVKHAAYLKKEKATYDHDDVAHYINVEYSIKNDSVSRIADKIKIRDLGFVNGRINIDGVDDDESYFNNHIKVNVKPNHNWWSKSRDEYWKKVAKLVWNEQEFFPQWMAKVKEHQEKHSKKLDDSIISAGIGVNGTTTSSTVKVNGVTKTSSGRISVSPNRYSNEVNTDSENQAKLKKCLRGVIMNGTKIEYVTEDHYQPILKTQQVWAGRAAGEYDNTILNVVPSRHYHPKYAHIQYEFECLPNPVYNLPTMVNIRGKNRSIVPFPGLIAFSLGAYVEHHIGDFYKVNVYVCPEHHFRPSKQEHVGWIIAEDACLPYIINRMWLLSEWRQDYLLARPLDVKRPRFERLPNATDDEDEFGWDCTTNSDPPKDEQYYEDDGEDAFYDCEENDDDDAGNDDEENNDDDDDDSEEDGGYDAGNADEENDNDVSEEDGDEENDDDDDAGYSTMVSNGTINNKRKAYEDGDDSGNSKKVNKSTTQKNKKKKKNADEDGDDSVNSKKVKKSTNPKKTTSKKKKEKVVECIEKAGGAVTQRKPSTPTTAPPNQSPSQTTVMTPMNPSNSSETPPPNISPSKQRFHQAKLELARVTDDNFCATAVLSFEYLIRYIKDETDDVKAQAMAEEFCDNMKITDSQYAKWKKHSSAELSKIEFILTTARAPPFLHDTILELITYCHNTSEN